MIRQFIIAKISVSSYACIHPYFTSSVFHHIQYRLVKRDDYSKSLKQLHILIYMHRLSRNVAPEIRQATPYTVAIGT